MAQVGVILDCDGTLLDSMGFWHGLDDRLASRVGVELTPADRDYMTAATIRECAEYLHDNLGVGSSPEEIERQIDDEMLGYYQDTVEPKKSALSFVKALHELGVPMGVASSTPPKLLHAGLERCGFSGYMKAICSVDDLGTSKREPLLYDRVRQALGTDASSTWVIEDAEYALKTARAAGYKTLSVYDSDIAGTPERLKATSDMYIDSFDDISAGDLLNL